MIAMAIILLLATIVTTVWKSISPKLVEARCLSNMRSIHISLSNYLSDVGTWPQIPLDLDTTDQAYEAWWLWTMEPFGAPEKIWKCPVLSKARVTDADGYELRMHYIPADFDANPISPRRWSNMPWLVERGNNHGRGALIAFPDGSIRSSLTQ